MVKPHTLIVRGLTKAQKDSLKRLAKDKNQSVNGYLVTAIDLLTCLEISDYKKKQKN